MIPANAIHKYIYITQRNNNEKIQIFQLEMYNIDIFVQCVIGRALNAGLQATFKNDDDGLSSNYSCYRLSGNIRNKQKIYVQQMCVSVPLVMVQKTLNKVKLLSTALCQRVHLSWIKWQKKVSAPPSLQSVVWCEWFFSYLAYIAWSIRYTLLFSSAKTSHIGLRPLRLDTVTATPARWEPTPIVLQP